MMLYLLCRQLTLSSCRVSLRVAYLLPSNLLHYVGPAGVWADINDILNQGLETMKVRGFCFLTKLLVT